MLPVTVYLALGSNLGDRISNIKNSIEYLKSIPRIKVGKMSGILETLPEGNFKNQSNYLNAALQIKTTVPPYSKIKSCIFPPVNYSLLTVKL